MNRAFSSLRVSDITTKPIKLKYYASYDSNSLQGYDIRILSGSNSLIANNGSKIPQENLNYFSIRHLYYSNYLTGSIQQSASFSDNYLQSTAADGTYDNDVRYFPTQSGAQIKILSIPRQVFGENISRKSFFISSSISKIIDDGNGNLIDIGYGTVASYYVDSGYYTPEGTDWYVFDSENNINRVGNIIYSQGMIIITNPNYQTLFT